VAKDDPEKTVKERMDSILRLGGILQALPDYHPGRNHVYFTTLVRQLP
jgi:hypothetical protein